MKPLPSQPTPYLGVALLIAITSFSVGGIIAALNVLPPSDSQMTAITGLLSFLVGALAGKRMEEIQGKESSK